jgi:hypothetical protein
MAERCSLQHRCLRNPTRHPGQQPMPNLGLRSLSRIETVDDELDEIE